MNNMGFIMLLVGSLAAGIGAIVYAFHREKERKQAWQNVADRRGGEMVDTKPSFWRQSRGIDVVVGAARVFVDTYTVSTGKSSVTYTRGRAHYPIEGGPVYRVYKERMFSSLGKALGTQDLVLGGDTAFDNTFMVKGDDIDAIRSVWTPEARRLMLNPLSECRVDVGTEVIKITGIGAWRNEIKIEALIDLTAELARVDYYGYTLLKSLGEANFTDVSGPWDHRRPPAANLVMRGRQVTITPAPSLQNTLLDLRVPNDGHMPPFEVVLGGANPPAALASPDLIPLIKRLDGERLVSALGALVIRIDALKATPDLLRAGAELLAILSGPSSSGAFR
ncbi:MAG: hypothetical protein KAI47_14670 [Deltaproteobacteria bacterium]|nr:hypothetical protein [Deltaproteobacteria bacterium]